METFNALGLFNNQLLLETVRQARKKYCTEKLQQV